MPLNYPDDYRDDWFDEDKPQCRHCEEHEDSMTAAAKVVEELVKILYNPNDHISVFKVNQLIEDICAYTGAKFDVEHLPPIVRMNKLGQELYNISSDQILPPKQ